MGENSCIARCVSKHCLMQQQINLAQHQSRREQSQGLNLGSTIPTNSTTPYGSQKGKLLPVIWPHAAGQPALFRSFYKWLKPGDKVLISDYCKSDGPSSPDFAAYIMQRGYDLHDVKAYGQMLKDAGFDEVIAEDRTHQFIQILDHQLEKVEKENDVFIFNFSQEDDDDIVGSGRQS